MPMLSERESNANRWRFKDGVYVAGELDNIDIEIIRAVCDEQSRTRWTSIASRDRLYQFMSMSDEESQKEMRRNLTTTVNVAPFEFPGEAPVGFIAPVNPSRPRANKRKRDTEDSGGFFFSDGQNLQEFFHEYSIANIAAACQTFISTSGAKTRADVYKLIAQSPTPIQRSIRGKILDFTTKWKRRHIGRSAYEGVVENPPLTPLQGRSDQDTLNTDSQRLAVKNEASFEEFFMKAPSKQAIDSAIGEYIERTSNAAMAVGVCAVCARECSLADLSPHCLDLIPSPHRLQPAVPHPAHDIFNGMLLHPGGVTGTDVANVCMECLRVLRSDKTPPFALANGMWIGSIPHELAYLTLPERLLIAKYFPAAYIIKLYPKKKGARHWDIRQMYSGLKGNVSTYQLDQGQIASMLDGTIMPQRAELLAATIGITFVGPKNISDKCIPGNFKVRRARVRRALEWLKENNPLFANITISETRLAELPENDVPYELRTTAKISSDIDKLHSEQEGYVPAQDGCDDENGEVSDTSEDETEMSIHTTPTAPAVLALSPLGVVDIDGVDITDSELMAHALANCSQLIQEEDYMIRRGSAFVNEYARVDPITGQRSDGGPSDANHLLGTFPTLFPYGQGGFEVERRVNLPYEAHVRWALQYEDRRFRKDPHFPFQVFGVCQKRQVCRAATLQMKRGSYFRLQPLLTTLSADDLTKASREETRGVTFSNPAVRALRSQLTAVKSKVRGSDESRISVRGKIWGTNLLHNPPSLWVTINPADTQDPIAQVLAGADIDLDNFCNTAGPDNIDRAINMASDPYASAKFFHFTIKTILEVMFGISRGGNGLFVRKEGIFGRVKSYVGTVEAQGRGSLHLHLLLWLEGAPTASEMRHALNSDSFRERIKEYINKTIRADLDGKNNAEVLAIPKVDAVSYSRPLNPRECDDQTVKQKEQDIARVTQYHQCSYANCLKVVKGRTVCKRKAPFPLAQDNWVDKDGGWGPKRLCAFLNNWNLPLLLILRANHDTKLIMNGGETNVLTWYITNYASKKQQRTSNVSALLAKRVAFHTVEERRRSDVSDINKRLIQRCANTLTRDREFSGPEIMSYLMGWGDRYESHHYVGISADAIIRTLKENFPGLRVSTSTVEPPPSDNINERPHAIAMVTGEITLKDQLHEYMFRGDEMSEMSLLSFVLDTYDAKAEEDDGTRGNYRTGRPPNRRVHYRQGFLKKGRCRVFRTPGHETLPHFMGGWFPRNDNPRERELYCASILALLKPWSDLSGLKTDIETFEQAFELFIEVAPKKTLDIIENIQYYYECYDGAKRRREMQSTDVETDGGIEFEDEERPEDLTSDSLLLAPEAIEVTDEDIEAAHDSRGAMRERLYAEVALNTAFDCGVFSDRPIHTVFLPTPKKAHRDDLNTFEAWEKHLKDVCRRDADAEGPALFENVDGAAPMSSAIEQPPGIEPQLVVDPIQKTAVQRPKRDMLKGDQRRAHDIIERQLLKRLAGEKPRQLRMLVLGHGGTGKSMLIGAITETFKAHNAEDKLAKCATSGVAAVIIGGQTLHSWAAIPISNPRKDDWAESTNPTTSKKRKQNIRGRQFLICDEVSMCTKQLKYRGSEIVTRVRAADGEATASDCFGGMDVIDFGDFHQFPPVGNPSAALYCDRPETDHAHALKGRSIFLEYDHVVILRDQMRITDNIWTGILGRLRVGECTEKDIEEVQKLVLTDPACETPDFSSSPWCDATLITPRNATKDLWNSAALEGHCRASGNRKYIISAEDTIKETGSVPDQNTKLAIAGLKDETTRNLRMRVELAVGMKAMVVLNIATEADLANGTRGTVQGFALDPREKHTIPNEEGHIRLQYPPPVIYFKPDMHTNTVFEGVPEGIIPISPSTMRFTVEVNGEKVKMERRQLGIVPAYAFTDYKSQGQTMEYVIVDISKPPSGHLSPFSVYVALSRSRGRKTIRILREFDPTLFMHHPSEDLRKDMVRLEQLDEQTKEVYEERMVSP